MDNPTNTNTQNKTQDTYKPEIVETFPNLLSAKYSKKRKAEIPISSKLSQANLKKAKVSSQYSTQEEQPNNNNSIKFNKRSCSINTTNGRLKELKPMISKDSKPILGSRSVKQNGLNNLSHLNTNKDSLEYFIEQEKQYIEKILKENEETDNIKLNIVRNLQQKELEQIEIEFLMESIEEFKADSTQYKEDKHKKVLIASSTEEYLSESIEKIEKLCNDLQKTKLVLIGNNNLKSQEIEEEKEKVRVKLMLYIIII